MSSMMTSIDNDPLMACMRPRFEHQINFGCTGLPWPWTDLPDTGYNDMGKHWLWFLPVDAVLSAAIALDGDGSCQGFSAYPSTFTGVGAYSGVHGVNTNLVTTPISQLPCNAATTSNEGRRMLRTTAGASSLANATTPLLQPAAPNVVSFINANFTKRMKSSHPAFKFLYPEPRPAAFATDN